ncbi:holin [Arthrobacter phage BlueFeather]|uniref:Holin n=1 Tax=Arthrobacter phage BlueFeather TaxID=2713258 RepID=A0A6G8R289_9CAUD|nr:holin [Arthrobacter phage BlueFeather]QIN94319.1 holin [Arthrobacter phage BlueFeather]
MADHAAPSRWIPSPKVRAYVYRVAVAAGPLVLFYGWMSAEEVALWLGLGGTALALPSALALVNTPKDGGGDA